ncbi:LicD family protein [Proteiniclasticum sp.]|uniref:LicD family protein n=1 Tax=Proteiniclasticum sp. TaxID=2053595 RepID=UPI002898F21A|nr:LicD family protein [Proteiniclasticum sp.]
MDIKCYDYKFPGLNVNIREIQKVELELLLEFDKICKKNNINYQLFAGTLLGAIRHNGFIPWDDDIDVCMLREEYDRFLQVAKKDLSEDYFLQTYDSDNKYFYQFAKIRKNKTIFMQSILEEVNMHHGIFIDIFPFDNVKPHTIEGNTQRIVLNLFQLINSCRINKTISMTNNLLYKYVRLAIHYVLKIIPKRTMDNIITKVSRTFNNSNTEYVGDLSLSTSKELYDRFTIKKNTFYDSLSWDFEGHYFPVPREYHEVLTKNYGDYMTPPPSQEPHHEIIEICFDTEKKV